MQFIGKTNAAFQLCLITRIDGIYIRENASVQNSFIYNNHYLAAMKILSTFIDNKLISVYLFGLSGGFHVHDLNILNQFVQMTVMPFESTALFFVFHTNKSLMSIIIMMQHLMILWDNYVRNQGGM